jgi:hypothetical protein
MKEAEGKKVQGLAANSITRKEWIFTGFIVLFCGLFAFVELNNHKLWTNDFRVYYDATHDFFAGNNPYQHNYGLDTGYFKYPPFALYLFSPQLLLPYGVGQGIHLALLAFSLVFSLLNMRRLLERFPVRQVFGISVLPVGMLYLVFACIAIHVTRELHLGNVNLVLLLLFNLGLRALLNGKELSTAAWFGLMLILKPIMLPVLLPLLLTRKWKVMGWMAVFGLFFFLFPALHIGWNGNIALWKDWFKAISAHGVYLTSFNAIGTLVKIHTGFLHGWIVSVALLLLLIGLMLKDVLLLKKTIAETVLVWSAVFSAFIPNFFVTDTEHFLLSAPLICLLLSALRNRGKGFHWIGFALGMLCFSFNSTDLLGGKLSDFVYNNGFLGIGNLLFLLTFLLVRSHPVRHGEQTQPPQ